MQPPVKVTLTSLIKLFSGASSQTGCLAASQGWAGSLWIWADGRKVAEPWESLTCLYSRVGQFTCAASCVSSSQKSQLPYILNVHKTGRVTKYWITQHDFQHVGHCQGYGNTVYWPQSQGYRDTTYLSYPDIWVREPDWLHLPYTGQSTVSLSRGFWSFFGRCFPRASGDTFSCGPGPPQGHKHCRLS